MHNQLKVEKFKACRFWLMYIAEMVLAVAGFLFGFIKFPEEAMTVGIFSDVVCDTSFVFIITLVSAWFVANDFFHRTIHNEIKVGYSRWSVIFSRTVTTFIMAILLHLTYIIASVGGYCVKWGFDSSIFTERNLAWLAVVLLQICANVSFIMLIVFALKKVTAAISGAIIFSIISCNVLRNFISDGIFRLTCFSLAQDCETETLLLSGALALVTIITVTIATHLIFRKSEIK